MSVRGGLSRPTKKQSINNWTSKQHTEREANEKFVEIFFLKKGKNETGMISLSFNSNEMEIYARILQ